MGKYSVTANGIHMGIYDAGDEAAALEAYAGDAGYRSWAEACEVAPVADGEVVVERVEGEG